jgi:hypothetical protein
MHVWATRATSRASADLDTKQPTPTLTIHAPGPERCNHCPPGSSLRVRFALPFYLHSIAQQLLSMFDARAQQSTGGGSSQSSLPRDKLAIHLILSCNIMK